MSCVSYYTKSADVMEYVMATVFCTTIMAWGCVALTVKVSLLYGCPFPSENKAEG